jgi:membrane-anchored mycosin MYCP
LTRSVRALTVVAAMLAAAFSIGPVAEATPPVKQACKTAPSPSGAIEQQPWNTSWFDAPAKIWPFSTGAGTTVAVIDAGVDGAHPQLAGKVLPGYDFVRNVAQGDVDCIPHGTAEAGVIAGSQINGIGFYGLAPDATILPVRVTDKAVTDVKSDQSNPVDPRKLAAGIDFAVDNGADVIDCAVVNYFDSPVVAAAVRRALSKGVVVVAMVGDSHDNNRDGIGPSQVPPPYPASYPGVIGVGAIDSDGRRVPDSQIGSYVDIVAPGSNVVASAIGGQSEFNGTAIASAFVAATAALVLSERPSLLGQATGAAKVEAVTERLLGTGGPELATEQSMAFGAGVVDPYRALTEATSDLKPVPLAKHVAPPPPQPDRAREAALRVSRHQGSLATRLALIVGAVVVVLMAGALVLPRGRARRWRAVRNAAAPATDVADGPEFVPGEALFEPPKL